MKNKLRIIIVFVIAIPLFTACPYESEFALSNHEQSVIDTLLLGKWVGTGTEHEGDSLCFELIQFNKHEYAMKFVDGPDCNNGFEEILRCFETKIGETRIMNITELGTNPKFSYFKFEYIKNKLEVTVISDVFVDMQFDNQQKFIDFITKNINTEDLFEYNYSFGKVEL